VTLSHQPDLSGQTAAPDHPPGELPRPPLHRWEATLVGVTALHLCSLPWALGGMHAWSQLTSLALAVTGFFLAALPRTPAGTCHGDPGPLYWPAARLLREPVFWAGLIFLGYITVQGFNPAWHFQSNTETWWLEPLDPVSWLPTGVDAPYARSNPWRVLTVFGSLLCLVASMWVGFTRRKSFHTLFTVLVLNAGLLAMFGLVQRLSGTPLIFWRYVSSNDKFVASFIYPNHGGPYFYLLTSVALGLAWWHAQRSRQQLDNSGPAAVFVFIAACCGLLVVFSSSRMSVILLLALILFLGVSLVFKLRRRTGPVRHRPELLPLVLIIVAIVSIGLVTLQTDKLRERFSDLFANPTVAVLDRTLPRQAAEEMFQDRWVYGWGAGCFRYCFPKYTRKYPTIHYFPHGPRRYWEHAHNDLIEFPVELGVVGLLPIAGIFGGCAWRLYRRRVWRNVVSLSLVLGCALITVHAWVDFVFQNPAILLTWSVLLAGALRWTELDQPGRRKVTAEPA